MKLDPAVASSFARVALANVVRAFPHKLDHLLVVGPEPRAADPVALHPAFFGSYDWHSAVHMHWLLVRILRVHPDLPEAAGIAPVLDRHLAGDALAAEASYFRSPAGATFERPYGWAWLLELRAELARLDAERGTASDRAADWASAVDPLARDLATRLADFLVTAVYPIRGGTHANTAFACLLAHDYAVTCGDAGLARGIVGALQRWFGSDRRAPTAYEPSLTDFLSPILTEAAAMRLAYDPERFATWLDGFLESGPGTLAMPPREVDRLDPQIAHLDGLTLSRAWAFARIAEALPAGHARRPEFEACAARHLESGVPRAVGGDYVGEHWLASFAALALGDVP